MIVPSASFVLSGYTVKVFPNSLSSVIVRFG